MRTMRVRTILIVNLLSILCTLPGCSQSPISTSVDHANSGGPIKSESFASLSDIHFDPFYDPTLVNTLIQTEYTKWKTVFSSSTIKRYSPYGNDTNYPLLTSALQHAAQVAKDAKFVIISGDFLSHHFNEDYYTHSGNTNPKALHAFINKTIAFVALMLKESFPNIPIYPVVGNNDSYCGDYQIQPAGKFLQATTEYWKGFFKNQGNTTAFLQTFPTGGYYTILPQEQSAHRLIALNTIYWSFKYQNTCGNQKDDPGKEQLQWLDTQLQQAAAQNEKVWLVYHIPPGVNPYATIHANSTEQLNNIISFWDPEYTNGYMDLMDKYSSVIVLSLVGHIHMDNFELVREKVTTDPVSYVHFTPSISPIYGNNPGFELVTYHADTNTLIDYETHYMDLGAEPTGRKWKPEYRFSTAYDQSSISTTSLQAVYQHMQNSLGNDRKNYIQYYNVDNTASPNINAKNWPVYWCAIGNITESQFRSCYQSLSSNN